MCSLVCRGLTNEEIGNELGITLDGVKFHVSSILNKLGVRSRYDVSAVYDRQVEVRERRPGILAVFSWLRLGVASELPKLLGATTLVASAVGVAILTWGVMRTYGSDSNSVPSSNQLARSAPCVRAAETGGNPALGVGVVDTDPATCQMVQSDVALIRAKWVQDGETFVAYNVDDGAFEIWDLEGHRLQTIAVTKPSQPDLAVHGSVSASPDGTLLLIERGVEGTIALRAALGGAERELGLLAGANSDAAFSPDGDHISYLNRGGGLDSLVLAKGDGADSVTLRSVDGGSSYVELVAWSPDGKLLLLMQGDLGAPCAGSPDPSCRLYGSRTWEVIDTSGAIVWKSSDSPQGTTGRRLTDVSWLGSERLLIGQPEVGNQDGELLPPEARVVEVFTGRSVAASSALASVTAISPDGRLAASGSNLIEIESLQQRPIAGYEPFDAWDWTSRGDQALVSRSGN